MGFRQYIKYKFNLLKIYWDLSWHDSFYKYFVCAWKEFVFWGFGIQCLYTSFRSICFYPKPFILVLASAFKALAHIYAWLITAFRSGLCLKIISLERTSLTTLSQNRLHISFSLPCVIFLKILSLPVIHYISVCLLSISLIKNTLRQGIFLSYLLCLKRMTH